MLFFFFLIEDIKAIGGVFQYQNKKKIKGVSITILIEETQTELCKRY